MRAGRRGRVHHQGHRRRRRSAPPRHGRRRHRLGAVRLDGAQRAAPQPERRSVEVRAAPRRVVSGRPRLPRRADAHASSATAASTGAPSAGRKRRRTGRATPAASRRSSSGARLDDLEKRLGLPRRRLHAEERRHLHLRAHRHDHRHDRPADRSRLRARLQADPRGARRAGRDQGHGVLRAVRHRARDQHQGPDRRRAAASARMQAALGEAS